MPEIAADHCPAPLVPIDLLAEREPLTADCEADCRLVAGRRFDLGDRDGREREGRAGGPAGQCLPVDIDGC